MPDPTRESPRDDPAAAAGGLGATAVQLSAEVVRTPERIVERYRASRDWRLYPKEWIFHHMPIGGDVLDFGCGTGELTTQLALLGAKQVYGLDVTPGLLEVTAKRAQLDGVSNRVEVICDFLQNVEPRQVDLVIACAVLHHCHPIAEILPLLLKWLKPGGTFVCVEPVVHLAGLETVRVASGVPFEPLDEGERKLGEADIQLILGSLAESACVHFRLLGRADRWLPGRPLRVMDHWLLKIPGLSRLAGQAIIHGKRR